VVHLTYYFLIFLLLKLIYLHESQRDQVGMILIRLWVGQQRIEVRVLEEAEIFLFTTASRSGLFPLSLITPGGKAART
jgi:hypothetical protein